MPKYKNTPFYTKKNDPELAFAIVVGRETTTHQIAVFMIQEFPSIMLDNFQTIKEFINFLNGGAFENNFLRLVNHPKETQWNCYIGSHSEDDNSTIESLAWVTLEDHREAINIIQELKKSGLQGDPIPELLLAEG